MDNFIVSARKYRPSTFESVVGQESITTTLKNSILKQQIGQAFLFCGPRGVGKTTCARIFAKTINCTHRTPEGEACGECESCKSFNASASFNIFEMDAASNNGVDKMRELVDQVRIPPTGAQYKVYIIDEVHMLSSAAFNAFLKTLEEPPAYAKFIMATTEKHKIMPTILSRCQVFDFKRIGIDDMVNHLVRISEKEHVEYEKKALHVIAQKADGGLRDALSMYDQMVSFTNAHLTYESVIDNLNILDADSFFHMVDYFIDGDVANAMLLYNDIMEKGFEGAHFLEGLSEHLRNLSVCKNVTTLPLLFVTDDVKKQYETQAQRLNLTQLINLLTLFSDCEAKYAYANNKRLHVEIALMRACNVNKVRQA